MSAIEVSLKVLMATASQDFGDGFRSALEEAGCRVETAATEAEITAAVAGSYEVIFLDLDLTSVDALAILQELGARTEPPAPPIILLKGEGEPAHVIQRGLDLGASGYVLKHRLPQGLDGKAVADMLRSVGSQPDGSENRRSPSSRPDACPYSAVYRFTDCPPFLPLTSGPRVSCSHLRIGTADVWRLYPRCAIGDATARAKYLRDQRA